MSVSWFLSRASLHNDPHALDIYRKFLISAQVTQDALKQLMAIEKPTHIFCLNGLFFPEAILCALAKAEDIPYSTYEKGFLDGSILIGIGRPANDFYISASQWSEASAVSLTPAQDQALSSYLNARHSGAGLPGVNWEKFTGETDVIRNSLQLTDSSRPLLVAFTNILWDTAVQDRDIGFGGLADWVLETIRGFDQRPWADLIVRVHPAEISIPNHPTEERLLDVIQSVRAALPTNVRIVPASDPMNSYALMGVATAGVVYTSTSGLEMCLKGIPVVVAADTHYRNRGFTLDVETINDYWDAIDQVITATPTKEQSDQQQLLARRYAYLFFFRLHQYPEIIHEEGFERPLLAIRAVQDLEAGRNPSLDRILDGILDGKPVITPQDEVSSYPFGPAQLQK